MSNAMLYSPGGTLTIGVNMNPPSFWLTVPYIIPKNSPTGSVPPRGNAGRITLVQTAGLASSRRTVLAMRRLLSSEKSGFWADMFRQS
jgi:hypothetical protein